MEFIDLKAIHQRAGQKIENAISKVLEHGRFINGPEVFELENALSTFCGASHSIAVSSGTAALEIALRALKIGPGDEVITTPFTWISTAEVIALVGATPVFADIDPSTYNLAPAEVEKAVTTRTKAIIAVNLFGQLAAYEQLQTIAEEHDLFIIEDAAQSFGAEQNGRKSGTFGTVSCTSFFPAKPLGCYGDGGAIFTEDPELARSLRAITNHGGLKRGEHTLVGLNGRCDTIQAAILLAKLPAFKNEVTARQQIGQRYTERLQAYCQTPDIHQGNTHIYAQYTIQVPFRESLAAALKAQGIPTAVYYKDCLHLQPVFHSLGYKNGDFPVAEKASTQVISLPFHPHLSPQDQDAIIDTIIQFKHAQ